MAPSPSTAHLGPVASSLPPAGTPSPALPYLLGRSYFLGAPGVLRRGDAAAGDPSLSLPGGCGSGAGFAASRVQRVGAQAVRSSTPWGRGSPIPDTALFSQDAGFRKPPGSSGLAPEPWRNRPDPGARAAPARGPGTGREPERGVHTHRPAPPPRPRPARLASLRGVRDGARGWREKGKSLGAGGRGLQPPRAARPRRSPLSPRLAATRARTAPGPAPQPGAPLLVRPRPRVRGEAARAAEPLRRAGASASARRRA